MNRKYSSMYGIILMTKTNQKATQVNPVCCVSSSLSCVFKKNLTISNDIHSSSLINETFFEMFNSYMYDLCEQNGVKKNTKLGNYDVFSSTQGLYCVFCTIVEYVVEDSGCVHCHEIEKY